MNEPDYQVIGCEHGRADCYICADCVAAVLHKKNEKIDRLQTLLAYAAPSVDHSCLAAATLGDHDCKRCEIDRILEAK